MLAWKAKTGIMINSDNKAEKKKWDWPDKSMPIGDYMPPIKKEEDFDKKVALEPSAQSSQQLNSWTYCHPEDWDNDNILDFIYTVAERFEHILQERFDEPPEILGERFQGLKGHDLLRMTKQQLTDLEPNYGAFVHMLLQQLLRTARKQHDAYMYTYNRPLYC